MDLSDPLSLLSSLTLGLLGIALMMYGKKQQEFAPALTGLVLCVVPYFVSSLWLSWLIAGGCLAGLYAISRQG